MEQKVTREEVVRYSGKLVQFSNFFQLNRYLSIGDKPLRLIKLTKAGMAYCERDGRYFSFAPSDIDLHYEQ